ncbi:MAG: zinc ribbon domain-containing protein [Firmicutes bacterium]|nr:zinc ribbon domain-containing protein [Bacillota bacterium]
MGKVEIDIRNAQTDNFPKVCMVCAEKPSESVIDTKFYYYPPWTYFSLIFFLFPFLLVALFFQKEQNVNVQVCNSCKTKLQTLPVLGCLIAIIELVLIVALGVFACDKNAVAAWLCFLMIPGIPIIYTIAYNNKVSVRCAEIRDFLITLNVPNDKYPAIYEAYIREHPLPMKKYLSRSTAPVNCPHCGNINMAGAKYCEKCGQHISPDPAPPSGV